MKSNKLNEIMVFKPTLEEFSNFENYIDYIESQGAHKMGIAKIIAPEEWNPRKGNYADVDVLIPQPIKQKFIGSQGQFQINNIIKSPINSKLFERLANTERYKPPHKPSPENMDLIERKYWKNINFNAPLYGADVSGTLYNQQTTWDLRKLGTILEHVEEDYEVSIDGVTTTYLYFGMWRSTFAWHTEDMDLYSINYLHFGDPKFWYAIPTHYGRRFEQLIKLYFGVESEGCSNFLRHKSTLISPSLLQRHNIPYNKIQQYPREFIVTFPFGYHAGFNTGFNCAESTNFATRRWIEYGKRAVQCDCRSGMVRFSMKCFVRRFQPELLELFDKGEDVAPHPEDGHINTRSMSGKKGIQANPTFDDPNFIITEPDESTDNQNITSKRIPSQNHFSIDYLKADECTYDEDTEDDDKEDDEHLNFYGDEATDIENNNEAIEAAKPFIKDQDKNSCHGNVSTKSSKEIDNLQRSMEKNGEKFWHNVTRLKSQFKSPKDRKITDSKTDKVDNSKTPLVPDLKQSDNGVINEAKTSFASSILNNSSSPSSPNLDIYNDRSVRKKRKSHRQANPIAAIKRVKNNFDVCDQVSGWRTAKLCAEDVLKLSIHRDPCILNRMKSFRNSVNPKKNSDCNDDRVDESNFNVRVNEIGSTKSETSLTEESAGSCSDKQHSCEESKVNLNTNFLPLNTFSKDKSLADNLDLPSNNIFNSSFDSNLNLSLDSNMNSSFDNSIDNKTTTFKSKVKPPRTTRLKLDNKDIIYAGSVSLNVSRNNNASSQSSSATINNLLYSIGWADLLTSSASPNATTNHFNKTVSFSATTNTNDSIATDDLDSTNATKLSTKKKKVPTATLR